MSGSKLEKLMSGARRLEPFLFFRNNSLDVVKLAAGNNKVLEQAGRNLIFLSYEKWGWALIRNLEREEYQIESEGGQ